MKNPSRIVLSALLTSAAVFAAHGSVLPDPPVATADDCPVLSDAVDSEGNELVATGVSWRMPMSICKKYPGGCPAGVKYGSDGNVVGCTIDPDDGSCVGDCVQCDGSNTVGNFCAFSSTSTCNIPGNLAQIFCGSNVLYGCTALSIPPVCTPKTTNGCYCTGTGTPTSTSCYVDPCK